MFKHILIPTDGSPLSDAAVEYGAALAKSVGATVSVVIVTTPFSVFVSYPGAWVPDEFSEELEKWADESLKRADGKLAAVRVEHDLVKVKHEQPFQAIIDTAANQGCDLILMASHGRRGLSAVVLGSETLKVLTHSKVPVLVYRPKA
jgi:nucleotide-binding universal stress UspA family protein